MINYGYTAYLPLLFDSMGWLRKEMGAANTRALRVLGLKTEPKKWPNKKSYLQGFFEFHLDLPIYWKDGI